MTNNLGLYTGVRFVDDLPNQDTDDYISLDIRLRWKLDEKLEMSITRQNLANKTHQEFGDSNLIERAVFTEKSTGVSKSAG